MTTSTISAPDIDQIGLRQQAHYWRALHTRAIQREESLRAKVRALERALRQRDADGAQSQRNTGALEAVLAEKAQQIEALKAKVAWLQQRLFGRKAEHTRPENTDRSSNVGDASDTGNGVPETSDTDSASTSEPRKRGQQKGSKGHGRKRRDNLPCIIEVHDLPEGQCRCPRCGQPFAEFPGTEDSEEIEWEVIVRRRVHQRKRYVRACECEQTPGLITAPGPPKLIPKGMFAISFWVRLLLEKWLFQRPLNRVLKVLGLEELELSQGTITGGLQFIAVLLQPVYARILERSRQAKRWKMDETRWMVFVEVEGKTGYRWWLWVVITNDTVAFLLEPSRSAEVPRSHLGEEAEGIILADRYKAYQALGAAILVAFCWSHIRRDFKDIHTGYSSLQAWAQRWVDRINELFDLNDRRVAVLSQPEAFAERDRIVRDAVDAMEKERERELRDKNLHAAARKVLVSLRNHWEGATLFVDNPEIPMDNNESERRLRDPAMGRKNYYGCGALWSGLLTAMLFTIFQTLLKNRIDPKKWLTAYFEACARNGGTEPEEVDSFLPWNLSEEQKEQWRYPKHPT